MPHTSMANGKLTLSTKLYPALDEVKDGLSVSPQDMPSEYSPSSQSENETDSLQEDTSGPKPVDPALVLANIPTVNGQSWASLVGGAAMPKSSASTSTSPDGSITGDSVRGSFELRSNTGSPNREGGKKATSPNPQVFASRGLAQIAKYLEGKSHLSTMRYCLGLEDFTDAPPLTDRVMVICFDTEGWTADSAKITEIGFNTFDSRDARAVQPGPHGENFLKHVYFYHIRVQPNAHLLNIKYCPGDPTANRFGQTRFLTTSETQECLDEAFGRPLEKDKPELGPCPLILLGHALGGDLDKLQNTIGWNPQKIGNIVKILDTQQIIRDVGWWNKRDQIGLPAIVARCEFTYRNAHTASNDAAMTTISAIKMVLPGAKAWHCEDNSIKHIQEVIDEVEARSQNHNWNWGSAKFCLRCGDRTHMQDDPDYQGRPCRVPVRCAHCEEEGRDSASYSHVTERCIQYALAHGNSALAKKTNEEKRLKKAKYIRRASEHSGRRSGPKGITDPSNPRVISDPQPMPYAPGGIFGPPADSENAKPEASFADNKTTPFGKKGSPFGNTSPFGRKNSAQGNEGAESSSTPVNGTNKIVDEKEGGRNGDDNVEAEAESQS